MSRLFSTDAPAAAASNPREIVPEMPNGKHTAEQASAKSAEPCNGKPADPTPSAQDKPDGAADPKDNGPGSRVERAEEMTDKIAVGVALFAAKVGRTIVRTASQVGETLSDIWAEAQSVRKKK